MSPAQRRVQSDGQDVALHDPEAFGASQGASKKGGKRLTPSGRMLDMYDHMRDPTCDETWSFLRDVASNNTRTLEDAFDAAPWDNIRTVEEAAMSLGISGVSVHVTSDVGTPEWFHQVDWVRAKLTGVRGRLVRFPEKFLEEENLEPGIFERLLVGRKFH
mmetsp:Transcript_19720/g.74623  ORF Transcript_19720/g.74623 Transcript_19720/m.74623 type:complete len:160 (-) Transcript_19720:107-586(-)